MQLFSPVYIKQYIYQAHSSAEQKIVYAIYAVKMDRM